MTANVDPTKAKFFPETLPEAIVVTPETSGVEIASYGLFTPGLVVFESLFTDVADDIVVRLDKDTSYGTLESECTCESDREERILDIPCEYALGIWAIGANTLTAYTAFTIKCGPPTIFEKIKYGISLTSDEQAIDQQFEISKRYFAGLLGFNEARKYQKVIEVSKKVTVAVGGNTTVGDIINVPNGKKAVILSFGTDHSAAPANNDTFISLTRGISETGYIKLDTAAMPGLNHDINCYIPSIDRFEVILESATGVLDMPIRFKYAISDITILEKIRWGLGLTAAEQAIATEMDLFNIAFTGVM